MAIARRWLLDTGPVLDHLLLGYVAMRQGRPYGSAPMRPAMARRVKLHKSQPRLDAFHRFLTDAESLATTLGVLVEVAKHLESIAREDRKAVDRVEFVGFAVREMLALRVTIHASDDRRFDDGSSLSAVDAGLVRVLGSLPREWALLTIEPDLRAYCRQEELAAELVEAVVHPPRV